MFREVHPGEGVPSILSWWHHGTPASFHRNTDRRGQASTAWQQLNNRVSIPYWGVREHFKGTVSGTFYSEVMLWGIFIFRGRTRFFLGSTVWGIFLFRGTVLSLFYSVESFSFRGTVWDIFVFQRTDFIQGVLYVTLTVWWCAAKVRNWCYLCSKIYMPQRSTIAKSAEPVVNRLHIIMVQKVSI